jgi:glycosyltransferase involved in cell wall biosynthesis
LLFSSLYPSSVRPQHGVFVETRLRQLLACGAVDAKVVAPVPWVPSVAARRDDHAAMARTPARETWSGIDVMHPRYLLPPSVGMNIAPFAMAAGALGVLRRLQREGYDFDAIDAHYYYPDGVAAALLARRLGKPLVITARGSDINLIAGFAWPRWLMCRAAQYAAASVAVSRALAARMAEMGMPRVAVLGNGVDLARFAPLPQDDARHRLGWPQAPTLLVVGNLVENKGQALAIEAVPALPGYRLHLVGDGPDAGMLRALVRRLGLEDRVLFCGRVEQSELATYYSAADLLLLPSSREGSPNVVLEALACGTPVVAAAVGGVPDLIDADAAGGLFVDRSASALAAAVREVAARARDPDAVRRHAERFDWATTTRAQEAIFQRLARPDSEHTLAEAPPQRRVGGSP